MAFSRLILLAACLAVVAARPMGSESTSSTRNLLQTAFCPIGCPPTSCVQDATKGGLRCQACQNQLVVDQVTGQCACPAGRYLVGTGAAATCQDCPKGSWCAGGVYNPNKENGPDTIASTPILVQCPANMTTLGMRSTSNRACVQLPGFYYTIENNQPGAVQCPIDTYGPGLKKQRACVPCPTGFVTDNKVQQTQPSSCIVPAGYYLKAPGQVAPCPRGEWKAGTGISANCTKCASGVTTPNEASKFETECKIVVAGYFANSVAVDGTIKSTIICPQGYYCPSGTPKGASGGSPFTIPSGETTIVKCPQDQWTKELGATAVAQCLTPPGYYTAAGGSTQACPANYFRADWKPAADAAACTACGEGVKAEKTDRVTQWPNPLDPLNSVAVQITSSSDDCYIMPGQGLYFSTLTNTWRAKNCDVDSYGVNNKTFGLTPAPCRDCPSGQVARFNETTYTKPKAFFVDWGAEQGFTSVMACVNKPGYGYDGRVSQLCPKGTYNPGDNYATCTQCDYGLTTQAPGAGITVADCGLAPGFGQIGGSAKPCPIGSFNSNPWTSLAGLSGNGCTDCPGHTTTQKEGTDDVAQCNLCDAGFGGANNCTTTCGGEGATATYGPAGREVGSDCIACSTQNTGFAFEWNMVQDLYQAAAISKAEASVAGDCLAKYSQTVDGAFYIDVSPDTSKGETTLTMQNILTPPRDINTVTTQPTHKACMDTCIEKPNNGGGCMIVTYDYVTKACKIHWGSPPVFEGSDVVAIKSVPAGDVAVSSKQIETKSGAIASGKYTFYEDEYSGQIKGQRAIAGSSAFTQYQDCLTACDNDVKCVGVVYDRYVLADSRWKNCRGIYGDEQVGKFQRSMTRADVSTFRSTFPLPLSG